MAVSGFYKTRGIHWDWSTASGRPFQYFVCGAAVAEAPTSLYKLFDGLTLVTSWASWVWAALAEIEEMLCELPRRIGLEASG